MKIITTFLSILFITILLNSCVVEKRVHNPGFNIQWIKKHKTTETQTTEKTEGNTVFSDLKKDNSSKQNVEITKEPLLFEESSLSNQSIDQDAIDNNRQESERNYDQLKNYQDLDDSTTTVQPKANKPAVQTKKLEGFGVAGTIFAALGFLIAGIPLGILAIIFGAIGITRIINNPEKYYGLGFSIVALALGLVVLIVTIAVVVSIL